MLFDVHANDPAGIQQGAKTEESEHEEVIKKEENEAAQGKNPARIQEDDTL